MSHMVDSDSIIVSLPRVLVWALIRTRAAFDESIADSMQKRLEQDAASSESAHRQETSAQGTVQPSAHKYQAEFLGETITARVLPEIFAQIVDLVARLQPEILDRLASIRTRKRRFVSRNREEIHLGSRHLEVMQTKSGWWVSKCIGQADLERALRELARVAGLEFGNEIKFERIR